MEIYIPVHTAQDSNYTTAFTIFDICGYLYSLISKI